MKIDGGLGANLATVPAEAEAAEAAGYDGVWTAETSRDPFFPLLLAAEHTNRIELGTGIAVAFARNPMTVANIGWDLQAYSHGRFNLGLGSQIKAHIEKRFSMPWSHPAPRMREFVLAMRAIWDCWQNGTPLEFRGEYYHHTLMTPFFNPGPSQYGPPSVYVAAVGEKMTEVAGEVADGVLIHAFTTPQYLREVTMPALQRGLERVGRSRQDIQLSYPAFVITGHDADEVAAADTGARRQIAFYGSTPAYRAVLDFHGWGDLQPQLNAMSKQGQWVEMGSLITDEILDAFAIVCGPDEVAPAVRERFGGIIDRISFYAANAADGDWHTVLAGFRQGVS